MSTITELHPDYRADDQALAEAIPPAFSVAAAIVGAAGVAEVFAGYKDSVESQALAA